MNIYDIAEICHEANRAYCKSIGDFTQVAWAEAPLWQQVSAENGVDFHRDNPDAGDSASHDSWMKEKVDAGWVYGEVKDPDAKTHPCIVPFEKLPIEQQKKDALFRSIVHALLDDVKDKPGDFASMFPSSAKHTMVETNYVNEGLTKREEFMLTVLPQIMEGSASGTPRKPKEPQIKYCIRAAYAWADAMIEAGK